VKNPTFRGTKIHINVEYKSPVRLLSDVNR